MGEWNGNVPCRAEKQIVTCSTGSQFSNFRGISSEMSPQGWWYITSGNIRALYNADRETNVDIISSSLTDLKITVTRLVGLTYQICQRTICGLVLVP